MNTEMIGGIFRAVFAPAIAYAIGAHIIPAGDYGAVSTALVSLVTAVWSIYAKYKKPV